MCNEEGVEVRTDGCFIRPGRQLVVVTKSKYDDIEKNKIKVTEPVAFDINELNI